MQHIKYCITGQTARLHKNKSDIFHFGQNKWICQTKLSHHETFIEAIITPSLMYDT